MNLPSTQRGAALMVALMFLVILTMLGLAAVRATTQQTRMAAGMQFQASAFQAAEAAIHTVTAEAVPVDPEGDGIFAAPTILVNAGQGNAQTRTPSFGSGAVVTSSAIVTVDTGSSPPLPGNSISGAFSRCGFRVDADARYGSTNAVSTQTQGLGLNCPNTAS